MNLKQVYAAILSLIEKTAGIDTAKKLDAGIRFRRDLNLRDPATLADKVAYLELHGKDPLVPLCTDKYAVREYIADKGCGDLLIPVVGGPWDSVDAVDFDALPNAFVLKATHGCKMNYFVPDKSLLDLDACRKEMGRWMATTYGAYSVEPHYREIPHRIYAEEYLGDMAGLTDYKIHCLNGEPTFVIAVTDRKADGDKAMEVTLDLFDMEWNPLFELQQSGKEKPGTGDVPCPEAFDKMKNAAKILSEDFTFVRVDLYERNGAALFGELTFSPACCVFPYLTDRFNRQMGERLAI